MKEVFKSFGKATPVLLSLAAIVAFFTYYFLIRVPNAQQALTDQNYRILRTMNDNFGENMVNIKNILRAKINRIDQITYEGNFLSRGDKKSRGEDFIDTLFTSANSVLEKYEVGDLRIEWHNVHSETPDVNQNYSFITDSIVFSSQFLHGKNDLYYSIPLNDHLFAPSIFNRQDAFESVIILDSAGNKISQIGKNFFTLLSVDTVKRLSDSSTKSNFFKKLSIGGGDYYVFLSPLTIASLHPLKGEMIRNNHQIGWICGVMPDDSFRRQTWGLPYDFVIVLLLILAILIFSAPILKLLIISKHEKLDAMDGYLAVAGIFAITTFSIILILIRIGFHSNYEKEDCANIDRLSNSISSRFIQELDSMSKQIDVFKRDLAINASNIKNDKCENCIPAYLDSTTLFAFHDSSSFRNYPFAENLVLVDPNGEQVIRYTSSGAMTAKPNVSDRNYFKKAVKKDFFLVDTNGEKDFLTFESLYNRIENRPVCVAAKSFDADIPVIFISAQMLSVMQSVLPDGWGFSIIDKDGKTLFSNDVQRIQRENFFEEVSMEYLPQKFTFSGEGPYLLTAAVNKGMPISFTATYRGDNYQMKLTPIKGLPYFLVVYHSQKESHTTSGSILSLSLIFASGAFGIVLGITLLIIVIYQLAFRRKVTLFQFEPLLPGKNKSEIYIKIIFFNSVMLITGVILMISGIVSRDEYLMLNLSMVVFGSIAFTQFSYLPAMTGVDKRKTAAILIAAAMELFFTIVILRNSLKLIFFDGAIILLLLYLSLPASNLKKVKWDIPGIDYNSLYFTFILTTTLTVIIVPSITYYIIAEQQMTELMTKNRLIDYVEKYESRMDSINARYGAGSPLAKILDPRYDPERKAFFRRRINSGLDLYNIYDVDFNSKSERDDENGGHNFIQNLIFNYLPYYDNQTAKLRVSARDTMLNNSFIFGHNNNAITVKIINSEDAISNDISAYRVTSASIPFYNSYKTSCLGEGNLSWLFKILIVLGFVMLIYIIILYVTQRLFHYRLHFIDDLKKELKVYQKVIEEFLSGKSPHKKLLVLLRSTTDSSKITGLIKDRMVEAKPYLADVPDRIEYLEIKSREEFAEMLDDEILMRHFHQTSNSVLIVSRYRPTDLIESPRRWNNPNDSDEYKKFRNNIEVFGSFIKLNYVDEKYLENDTELREELDDNPLYEPGDNDNKEAVLSQCKVKCMKIWDDCSLGEKLFLHDLATDNMVNIKDRRIIRKLIAKGLIVYDGSLHISSEVFRLFVNNFVRASDLEEQEVKMHSRGAWSKTKIPLLIVVTALLIFIFLTQRQAYAAVASSITGIIAVFNLVSRFIDSVPGKNVSASP